MWKRFVDDNFVVIKAAHKQEFLDHINSINHHIQFTSEDSRPDGSMPFLIILVAPRDDGRLCTTVYRIYICNGIAITPSHQNIVW